MNFDFQQDVIERTFTRPDKIKSVECASVAIQILHVYLDSIADNYMSNGELLLLKFKIQDLFSSLEDNIDTYDSFGMWMYVETILDKWEPIAIEWEKYEGLVNLKKLRQLI
jgi:hypothetical protein